MSVVPEPSAFVYKTPPISKYEELEDTILDAFEAVRNALASARPVVIILSDGDLLGHGEPTNAALAGALLGLTRAFAIEGKKAGWRINALSVTDEVSESERELWIRHLCNQGAAKGGLMRLGDLHLGRVAV